MMTPKRIPAALVLIGASLLLAAGPTSKPAPGPDTSIARDQYHFPAPPSPEWKAIKPDPTADSITYINAKGDGAIQLVLWPKGASLEPDTEMQVAVGLVKKLKEAHVQKHVAMVMEPKIEKDKRFAFIIHEKYKVGDHVADELHIYRSVGPRVLMLTVNAVSDDADKDAQIHKDGEDLLAAAKFNRKAFKRED